MRKSFYLFLLFFFFCFWIGSSPLQAKSGRFRLMWRTDPARTMVVGWDQQSGSSPVIHYDIVDHGKNYKSYRLRKAPDASNQERGMKTQFARLDNLQPNTVYYFVISDSEGVSERYSFKTTPATPDQPLTIIAGGDSRNFRDARRSANRLVSRIRPDFVIFAGDMTASDNAQQWQQWFDDWQLTIGQDGRIFPIIVARGNHEYSNGTLVDLFDVPSGDNFYELRFGGDLLQVLTLNSMIAAGGGQAAWLEDKLRSSRHMKWRMAQYHHAIRPHSVKKTEKDQLYMHWAPLFHKYRLQLVLESDSHVVKWTYPLRPTNEPGSREGFIRDDNNGTVYLGEGCWGAPLRPADDNKKWTRNSGSFNQFKLIFVRANKVEVRTVPTDQAIETDRQEGQVFQTPTGLNIWEPDNGAVVELENNMPAHPRPNKEQSERAYRQEELSATSSKAEKNKETWSKLPALSFDPDSEEVSIPFNLPTAGEVSIQLFDLEGDPVKTFSLSKQNAGSHRKTIPLPGIGRGTYLLVVRFDGKALHYYQVNN